MTGLNGDGLLTWTCHVCGEDRPDELVGTHIRVALIGATEEDPGIPLRVSVRYCADREACSGEAPELAARWLKSAGGG